MRLADVVAVLDDYESQEIIAGRQPIGLQYLEHRSLALDLQIMWKTPLAALRREDHTEAK